MSTKALARTAASAGESSPTVSVAEAMGIPTDWSLAGSLNPGADKSDKGGSVEVEDADDEDPETPEAEEAEEPAGGEKPDAPAVGKAAGKAAAEKPADKAAAKAGEKKAETKGKPAKTEATPKAGEKTEPAAEPAKKADTPLASAAKIRVAGKDYTQAELEEMVRAKAAPAKPAAEPKKDPTPEELEVQRKATETRDNDWVTKHSTAMPAALEEAEMDVILAGGKDAVAAMQRIRQTDMARAVLVARKSMFADLQPILDDIRTQQAPLISRASEEADNKAWESFSTTYPELSKFRKASESVAHSLIEREPDRVRPMGMQEFQTEVARLTKKLLKEDFELDADSLYAASTAAKPDGAEAAAPEGKAAPAAGGKPADKPAPVVRAKVNPPGGNPPVATTKSTGKAKTEDGAIIASLW